MKISEAFVTQCLVLTFCLFFASPSSGQGMGSLFAPRDSQTINAATTQAIKEPIDDLVRDVEHLHPVAMLFLAKRLWDADRHDEAVFWFYEGQLRWKAHLIENRDTFEADMFGRLHSDIGPDINHYAFRDVPALLKTIDKVLEWDASHPDDLTQAGKSKDDARKGLQDFKVYIVAHEDEINKKRQEDDRLAATQNPAGDDPYAGQGGALMGTPQEMIQAYDAKNLAAFKVGVTTKKDVVQALGKPEWWDTDKDGVCTIGYSFHKATPGLAMMGMVQRVTVSLKFDSRKVLSSMNLPPDQTP